MKASHRILPETGLLTPGRNATNVYLQENPELQFAGTLHPRLDETSSSAALMELATPETLVNLSTNNCALLKSAETQNQLRFLLIGEKYMRG